MLELIDTHCHIHFDDYGLDPETVLGNARAAGVKQVICVGCTLEDSRRGIEFASQHQGVSATIGLHPHEASRYIHDHQALQKFANLVSQTKVVAIGEAGLDYYYQHSAAADQKKLLHFQLDLAKKTGLPMIFHIRDAKTAKPQISSVFADFWSIYDSYRLPGVVHSFSAGLVELQQILQRNLFVGLNGIMTFTKNSEQLAAAKALPLDKMVLETDAPYLTPAPYRGTICEPKHVSETAVFLAQLRGQSLEEISKATTANARRLFGFND